MNSHGTRPAVESVYRNRPCAASEGGSVPIAAADTIERRRLAPGEMFLVDTARGTILDDAAAKRAAVGPVSLGMTRSQLG